MDGLPGPTRPPSHPARTARPLSALRGARAGGRRGLVSRAARSPLGPASGYWAPTYLAGGAGRGPGLAAGGGGGASRPSDHLGKRAAGRGGGRLLVQLQPTSRSRFGGPRLPASARSPPQPPRRSAGSRGRWAASSGQPSSAGALTPIAPPAPGSAPSPQLTAEGSVHRYLLSLSLSGDLLPAQARGVRGERESAQRRQRN